MEAFAGVATLWEAGYEGSALAADWDWARG